MIIKKLGIKLFIILFLSGYALTVSAFVPKWVECALFGSVLVKGETKEVFDDAEQFFDVSTGHGLYYARWPWNYYSSFTGLSGTWINEAVWENLDLKEQIFAAYHEIAHAFCSHSLKKLLIISLAAVSSGVLTHKYAAKKILQLCSMSRSSHFNQRLVTATVSLLSALVATVWYTRQSEQEADEQAIYALCIQERQDLVEDEIERLEDELDQHGDSYSLWFGSLSDKISYFKRILKENY